MLKQIAKKILPKKAYKFIKGVITPPKIDYYPVSLINQKLEQFGLKRVAILVGGQTEIEPLFNMPDIEIVGIYSFNLDIIDEKIGKFEVKPLLPNTKIQTDGWIVSSSNETDSFSLNQFLLESKSESQIITQHIKLPNGTKYYSYADFFHNDQKTIVHINNYFRRCYTLGFPLSLTLTLRDLNGKIIRTSQIILPPDSIRIIKSEDFKVKDFTGYLEVEFEIAKKVTPFLHYMIDYFSDDFISSNHQSGLGLHPANSKFTRGYIPTDSDKSLEVCLFQRHYDEPVLAKAILNYTTKDGEEREIVKDFPLVAKNQMIYQDIKKLFKEIDFSEILSPTVTTQCEKPLHRPNYYYTQEGKKGYYDTSHAGPDLRNHIHLAYKNNPQVSKEEKEKMDRFGVTPMDLKHYILPSEFEIESFISIGGNDTTCKINKFEIFLHDKNGNFVKSFNKEFELEKERYLNINKFLESKNMKSFEGTISFRPGKNSEAIPISAETITGFVHKKSGYMTSTAGNGSHPDNIPFYFRSGPPNYMRIRCQAGTTDIFARGTDNDDFDTFFIVSFQTADKTLNKKIEYEIQITNIFGKKKIIYRELASNGYDMLKLSNLIKESGHSSPGGFYTIWFFSSKVHLYVQHILYRKRDSAIAVEHCYAGKFGL